MSRPPRSNTGKFLRRKQRRTGGALWLICLALVSSFLLSCKQISEPKAGSLYSEAIPPRKQEFRWGNGRSPKSFDPALASTPPETDIVRAIYEGLTEIDPKTLHEVPAAAEKWATSDDGRTWTFQLRKNVKWSNGDAVTARDFVSSWKRLVELGETTAHRDLFNNIIGMRVKIEPPVPAVSPEPGKYLDPDKKDVRPKPPASVPAESPTPERPDIGRTEKRRDIKEEQKFGVEAINDFVLKVSLVAPDKDFPRLVAHPIFRPIFGDGRYFAASPLDPTIVTNGPFRIASVTADGISAIRSDQYWDAASVKLESIRFIPAPSAEKALASYRAGDLDAVTNVDLEPLALKLLSPYADFRQATHNALNFFEFNLTRPPFTDRRVREALAVGFERDRLTEGEMKGATEPAFHFLPYDTDMRDKMGQDTERAKKLLESAGFPDGASFPVIRLVVNRNETQLRVARAVARMWKQNLNLNAEIVVKENAEMEAARTASDFDLIRRGVVFPTVDRSVSFNAIFPSERERESQTSARREAEKPREVQQKGPGADEPEIEDVPPPLIGAPNPSDPFSSAIYDFRLIPLYFPMSYGLVKPYVLGFDINGLDSPSLKSVQIDSGWQPSAPVPES